jgi:hypothetical protein
VDCAASKLQAMPLLSNDTTLRQGCGHSFQAFTLAIMAHRFEGEGEPPAWAGRGRRQHHG